MAQRRRTQFPAWVVIAVLAALIITTFGVLLIMGTLNLVPERPSVPAEPFTLYLLTAFNFVALSVFSFILARLVLRLWRERRAQRLGSQLKWRLVRYFIVISILPLIALASFSYLFINVTIDKWFGKPQQAVLQESQDIYELYVKDEVRHLRQMTQTLRLLLEELQGPAAMEARVPLLSEVTDNHRLILLQVVNGSGRTLFSRRPSAAELPGGVEAALAAARAEVLAGREMTRQVALPDRRDKGFLVVAAVPFRTHPGGILTLYQSAPEIAQRAANIAYQHELYERQHRKQGKIRRVTLQVLGLITFLLLFAATWAATHLAKGIAFPIQALAEATQKVAQGDFNQTVHCLAEDELAVMVDSFNRMTAQLKENRRQLEASAERLRQTNLTLEERRRYIETVLESLSTGIISVDADNRLTTINGAAMRILRLHSLPSDRSSMVETLAPVLGQENINTIDHLIEKAKRTSFATEDIELAGPAGASHLVVSASALRDEQRQLQGLVIMIEDITELVRAQRQAVWSEVARRMAHEIKNPLTPIQLSAERIARNLERSATTMTDERFKQVVNECTATIVSEVYTLQRMVNEFARFARLPQVTLEEAWLNHIVRATIKLYEDRLDGVSFESQLAQDLPPLKLDAEQIKRALVNLIDNAIEAVHQVEGDQRIRVETHYLASQELVQLVVSDTGSGIDPKDYPRLFTPYFSKRAHGTGLGLAIVNHIVAEHHGKVRVEPNQPHGARFLIEFPTGQSAKDPATGGAGLADRERGTSITN